MSKKPKGIPHSNPRVKIGRLIAWGGEHFVYEYDTDSVIKFSMLYFFLGSKAKEKATQDYDTCKKFFGKYLLETEIAILSNNKHIVQIQPNPLNPPPDMVDSCQEKNSSPVPFLKGYFSY